MKVIIFGVSGMVGQGVLRECLADSQVTAVLSVGRSGTDTKHPKFQEIVHRDLLDLQALEPELAGYDACFFCLGATAARLTEAAYAAINHDIPVAVGTVLARINPGMTFVYVSGAGTDSSEQGRTMWARVKGKTENDLLRLDLNAYMLRPAFIQPMHGEVSKTAIYRFAIAALGPVFPILRLLFPGFVTTTERLGRVMLVLARAGNAKRVLETRDVNELAQQVAGKA